jgi:general secretion pathway protein D
VRLIGDLLQSIDKDRAEVVMDVSIYEVSKSDFRQLGNQVGIPAQGASTFALGGSPGFSLLTDNGIINNAGRGVNLGSFVGSVPTALAAALVIPPSVLTAFHSKSNTKLIASTQVHAFNGEESTARIGQRVPVQTAQAFPFSVAATTPVPGQNNNVFGNGGFPVINYEPTGLTLKFTPQVFPNLDVQVKMNIESKDVLGAGGLTPTFTERTITGTARVQNNRTMMLASVSQDVQTNGRQGLPIIGGLPILGRLFTSPTRDNRTIDIVIAVTPRVLRAPAITPRDEEMRPSGTLQSPTTGSLAELIRDADREDQIAAARTLPKDVALQLPDAQLVKQQSETAAQNTTPANLPPPAGTFAFTPAPAPVVKPVVAEKVATTEEELASFVPAPKSLISEKAAANVATVNPGGVGTQNAVLTTLPKATETTLSPKPAAPATQLSLLPDGDVMKIGEKRRYAIQLNSEVPLNLALLALKFDPKVVKVHGLTAGNLLAGSGDAVPLFTPSIDASGTCMISISSLNGKASFKGSGPLIFIDIEAIGTGNASLVLVKETLHFVGIDGRNATPEVIQGIATVKQ